MIHSQHEIFRIIAAEIISDYGFEVVAAINDTMLCKRVELTQDPDQMVLAILKEISPLPLADFLKNRAPNDAIKWLNRVLRGNGHVTDEVREKVSVATDIVNRLLNMYLNLDTSFVPSKPMEAKEEKNFASHSSVENMLHGLVKQLNKLKFIDREVASYYMFPLNDKRAKADAIKRYLDYLFDMGVELPTKVGQDELQKRQAVIVLMSVLINRLLEKNPALGPTFPLLLTSFLITQKVNTDYIIIDDMDYNRWLAVIGAVSIKLLNQSEANFLKIIDYNIALTRAEYQQTQALLNSREPNKMSFSRQTETLTIKPSNRFLSWCCCFQSKPKVKAPSVNRHDAAPKVKKGFI